MLGLSNSTSRSACSAAWTTRGQLDERFGAHNNTYDIVKIHDRLQAVRDREQRGVATERAPGHRLGHRVGLEFDRGRR